MFLRQARLAEDRLDMERAPGDVAGRGGGGVGGADQQGGRAE